MAFSICFHTNVDDNMQPLPVFRGTDGQKLYYSYKQLKHPREGPGAPSLFSTYRTTVHIETVVEHIDPIVMATFVMCHPQRPEWKDTVLFRKK